MEPHERIAELEKLLDSADDENAVLYEELDAALARVEDLEKKLDSMARLVLVSTTIPTPKELIAEAKAALDAAGM